MITKLALLFIVFAFARGNQNVCVLGTGSLGSAIARALSANSDVSVSVWNRSPSKAQALAQETKTIKVAASVAECVAKANVVLTVLMSGKHDLQVLEGVTHFPKDLAWVSITTTTPKEARANEVFATERKIIFSDAAVMGTPNSVGSPKLTILSSGSVPESVKKSVLERLGTIVSVPGGGDRASALDSALLAYMYGSYFGYLHGVALAQQEGLPIDLLHAFVENLNPALMGIFGATKHFYQSKDHAGEATALFSNAVFRSGIQLMLQQTRDNGAPNTSFLQAILELLKKAPQDSGVSALVDLELMPRNQRSEL